MQVQPYLYFAGYCEAALEFYHSIFGGKMGEVFRYAGSPIERDMPPGWSQKVMHATFEAGGTSIMAADSTTEPADTSGTRVWLCVIAGDHEEGLRIFDALADAGSVAVPYEKKFWGSSFGMLVDKFNIPWMVSAG